MMMNVDLQQWLRAQGQIARSSPTVTYVGDMMAGAFFDLCAKHIDDLHAALAPIRDEADHYHEGQDDALIVHVPMRVGELRAIRSALSEVHP